MKNLFVLMAIAIVMTAVACNNSADTAAAAAADSTRIADSTAKATATADSIKASMTTTIVDSTKKVDSTSSTSVKTMPMDSIQKGGNKAKVEETGK
jgi:outer membrane lipoprotein-sorting protein